MECARTAPERVASMVLLAPAGIAREGMLIHFRLASLPLLGEMIMQLEDAHACYLGKAGQLHFFQARRSLATFAPQRTGQARFDHHQTKWFRPINRKQKSGCFT